MKIDFEKAHYEFMTARFPDEKYKYNYGWSSDRDAITSKVYGDPETKFKGAYVTTYISGGQIKTDIDYR